MMRSIAEFIMKGRLQAALLAMLGIPLLSAGAIGLVTLRLGHQQGALILMAAMIPTLAGAMMDRVPELLFWVSLTSGFSVFGYAVLLRASVSWVFTLVGSCVLMAITLPLMTWQFDGLRESFSRVLAVPQALGGESGLSNSDAVVLQSIALVSGIVALMSMISGFTSVVFARWWQSLLYNPGGFGDEFRALRIDILPAVVLAALSAFCLIAGSDYVFWSVVMCSPLVIAALALVHFVAKLKGLGISWLVSFYLLTVFFLVPMIAVLALIGLLDAVFNFRKRF